jgi:hypothetical protein
MLAEVDPGSFSHQWFSKRGLKVDVVVAVARSDVHLRCRRLRMCVRCASSFYRAPVFWHYLHA